mmetsp:Transcript_12693/g.28020  ORF Transcript_12693/g.28020 Transcript_12693/m.28020 type:complete len:136 (-) Transcript_12693:332-739(-)
MGSALRMFAGPRTNIASWADDIHDDVTIPKKMPHQVRIRRWASFHRAHHSERYRAPSDDYVGSIGCGVGRRETNPGRKGGFRALLPKVLRMLGHGEKRDRRARGGRRQVPRQDDSFFLSRHYYKPTRRRQGNIKI